MNLELVDDRDEGGPTREHEHPVPASKECSRKYGIH